MLRKTRNENGKDLQEYVGLITGHQWVIRGFILALMPGSPDVDDVLQETNIVIWEKRARFKPGTDFLAWAKTIARFQVMRHRGIVKRFKPVPFSDEFLHEIAEKISPDDGKKTVLSALDHCLAKLDDKQRQLLMVRYTSGQSIKDHSVELGTSAEVLRVTLHRIRQALKRCIETRMEERSA